jgi:hypothetical protein
MEIKQHSRNIEKYKVLGNFVVAEYIHREKNQRKRAIKKNIRIAIKLSFRKNKQEIHNAMIQLQKPTTLMSRAMVINP